MKVIFHRSFVKAYVKLPKSNQLRVDKAIEIFQIDPFDRRLCNHKLKGEMKGKRAIHAEFDLCLIFMIKKDDEYAVFLDVGRHENVYK